MTAGPIGAHAAPRTGLWGRVSARPVVIAGAAVLVAGLAGGAIAYAVTRGPTAAQRAAHAAAVARAQRAAHEAAVANSRALLLGALDVTPAAGTGNVPLDTVVTVVAGRGTLTAVKVATASGAVLPGAISPSTGHWTSTGGLLPSATYTVSVNVAGDGVTADRSSTFTTLTPVATVTPNVFPTTGTTVGVGQPFVLYFNHNVASPAVQKAIESRLTVAMSNPVPGGWYWFSQHELHFRPKAFWPVHETVEVTGDLNGIDVGGGEWTAGSVLSRFTIGEARISYANLASEVMTVTQNGAVLYSFPISGGRPQYPTMDGIHVVLDRESVVHMVSSTVGIPVHSPNGYDEYVYDDVHISDSGEYVHAAPWSVGSQGVTNVSHGCINLSPGRAQTFYDFSRVGDIVEVTGSSRPPVWGDHGVMDWSGPDWAKWDPARVVALPGSPAATSTTSSTSSSTSSTTVAATTSTAQPVATTTRPALTTSTARATSPTTLSTTGTT